MLSDDTSLISALLTVREPFAVWNVNDALIRTEWLVGETNLAMKDGNPFGWIRYVSPDGSTSILVAVRWNQLEGQLHCFVRDRGNFGPFDELERDARVRVGSLLSSYAQLGAEIARQSVARLQLVRAAGLGGLCQP